MTDAIKDLKYRKWIPTIEKLSLHDYERYALGLTPGEKIPFQMYFHDKDGMICIHTVELKLKKGDGLGLIVSVGEEVVVQQPFDMGGYYLSPTRVKG